MKKSQTDAISQFARNFVYKADPKRLDKWIIITEVDKKGKYHGDCEDFALTALYKASGENIFKFFWYLLTFQAMIWHVTTVNGGGHAVLSFRGKYLDNWTLEPVSKEEMIEKTGHTFKFPYVFPLFAIKMLFGFIIHKLKK